MVEDLEYVTFQTAKPRGDSPGTIEEGLFCVEEDTVILYGMDGQHLGKQDIFPNLTPRQTAAIMLKRRAGMRNSDFNRRLNYPEGF